MGALESLSIIPYAGLCNRMRAISTGIFAARQLKIPAYVYWNQTHDCHARWHDLFREYKTDQVKIIENRWPVHMISGPRTLFVPAFLQSFIYDKCWYNFSKNNGIDFSEYIRTNEVGGRILVQSGCDMESDYYNLKELFNPTTELEERIDKIVQNFPFNTIGVHIRRSDNQRSIANASIEDFKEKMREEINYNPRVVFYLATDDAIVKNEIKKEFGERIIAPEFELSRGSTKGMKDALVDLICLSRTSRIIGSFYSSYTEMAASIGDISLEVITKK